MPLPSEYSTTAYPIQHYMFAVHNVAASASATAMKTVVTAATSGALAITSYSMPWDGWIVAVTAELQAACTAGTLTITPTLSTVAITATNFIQIFNAAGQRAIKPAAPTSDAAPAFTAGQYLGCNYATNSGFLPDGSADLLVHVYVVFNRATV